MDEIALDRFLMHYERLTRWELKEMPDRADILIEIGPHQRPVSTRLALPSRGISL
jgi:D-glycerate 3-kinase